MVYHLAYNTAYRDQHIGENFRDMKNLKTVLIWDLRMQLLSITPYTIILSGESHEIM